MVSSSFLIAAGILAITPGPGIAYVVIRTAAGGLKNGLASTFGNALGGLVHVIAATFGLSAVITQSAWVFSVIKLAGIIYMMYLGVRIFLQNSQTSVKPNIKTLSHRSAFLEGILLETLNVKTALFFLAFLPQFLLPEEPVSQQLLWMGCISVGLNTIVDVLAVIFANRLLASKLTSKILAGGLYQISGVSLIGLGVYLSVTDSNGSLNQSA